MVLLFATTGCAQKSSTSTVQEVKIKTSAQCGMCKDRLEGAMAYEKGVKKSVLDLNDKVLTVTYDAKKTSPEKLRLLVAKTGYDADEIPADKTAYDALPPCCKKKTPASGTTPACGGH